MEENVPDYALGHSDQELERLNAQARAFEPLTRRLLLDAGITSGMRVLDIGSGGGDVSVLLATLVGPSGSVVGVDTSADAVSHATSRAAAEGITNVSFCASELSSLPFGRDFDAIVGRLVLMYLPQPSDSLRSLVRHLRRNGILAFQEMDILAAGSFPPAPLIDRARAWISEAFRKIGADVQTGPQLFSIFKSAGLPPPHIAIEGLAGGSESDVPYLVADVVKALLPVMETHGIVTAQEADVGTLEERMRQELDKTNGIALMPPFYGAWARVGQNLAQG
jgi:SAM-dependent methyltransferase